MSRTALAAATLSLALAASSAAFAQSSAQAQPALLEGRSTVPADAATRAAYERADPLSRSIFWTNESNINPMDPIAGVRMAQALRELGQYDQAATAAENVLSAQPDNVEAMLELGRSHIARGQAFYGIASLETARDRAPRDWRAWSLLGVAYQQVRRPDDAQAAWSQALAISPNNPDILTNSAIAYMGAGDLTQAEDLLRRAASQPSATMKVHQNLALTLGLQGKMSEAESILRRQLPPDQADQNLAWLASRTAPGATPISASAPAAGGAPLRRWDSLR